MFLDKTFHSNSQLIISALNTITFPSELLTKFLPWNNLWHQQQQVHQDKQLTKCRRILGKYFLSTLSWCSWKRSSFGKPAMKKPENSTKHVLVTLMGNASHLTPAAVCWLVVYRPSNMLLYLRDRSAQTILPAATLRRKSQIKLSTSPSHSILTLGQPVPALTL